MKPLLLAGLIVAQTVLTHAADKAGSKSSDLMQGRCLAE